jgi:hypothetical protein
MRDSPLDALSRRSRGWAAWRGNVQQPSQRDLARRGPVALGDPRERRIWAGEPACRQRVPRNKGDAGTGAHIDQPVGRSVAKIVAVLDGDDLRDGARSGKLPLRDVRYTDVADLPAPLEVDERTDRILDRYSVKCRSNR